VCFDDPDDAVPAPVDAGGMVVFSSLTPHCTGPNRTSDVRKAYIVQYAPFGAAVIAQGTAGKRQRIPADAPDRQFVVLQDGQPVSVGTP
jgi:ectoine hydroxylase-related dioxygenase (phytanoyl-CoA dioxygenase family)